MEAARARYLLALDVGERRIGVAVSEGTIAVPLTIIEHTQRATDIARILEIAGERHASAIVIGLPYDRDGGEGEQARLIRRFGDDLAAATELPLIYQDERLSSADVAEAARSRRKRHGRKTRIDDLAAALILQRYIDAQEPLG